MMLDKTSPPRTLMGPTMRLIAHAPMMPRAGRISRLSLPSPVPIDPRYCRCTRCKKLYRTPVHHVLGLLLARIVAAEGAMAAP